MGLKDNYVLLLVFLLIVVAIGFTNFDSGISGQAILGSSCIDSDRFFLYR